MLVLWNTYGDCENYGIMEGHKGAVLDLQWSRDSRAVYTASADYTLGTWDTETGERLRKHVGHEDIVNSVSAFLRGGEMLASGSDDCSIGVRSSLSLHPSHSKELSLICVFSRSGIHDQKPRCQYTKTNTQYVPSHFPAPETKSTAAVSTKKSKSGTSEKNPSSTPS